MCSWHGVLECGILISNTKKYYATMYVEGGETMKMQKMISSIMTMGALVFGMLMPIAPVMAQNNTIGANDLGISYGQYTGLGSTDVRITIARIIRVAMGLLGIIAVVIVLIGGFTWMTAGGNEEKVGEAKKWIFAGIIGLAIILSAFAIATFVINNLVTATTAGDSSGSLTP